MSDQLHEDLQHLVNEIESLHLEEEAISRLTGLVDEIRAHDVEQAASPQLIETVDSLITHFEAEHPTLIGVLNRLLVSLSNMGV